MYLPDSSLLTNIKVQGHARLGDILFEKKYITIRDLESRLYADDELIKLPDLPMEHPHYKEWQARKRIVNRLYRYLANRHRSLEILEVGCGNGWLSRQMAEIPGAKVIGLDINFTELQQAARVFSDDPNLSFVHGDIRSGILSGRRFDCIIFAASIEYFPSLKKIIHACLSILKPNGEVHLIDTRFHKPAELERARKAMLAYYSSFGYPEMADYHYHYCLHDLKSFHYHILHNPHSIRNRFAKNKNTGHWIVIRNKYNYE
jgi:ubiquinone/menaquinone biosynthesis C-methylase UbiE